MLDERFDIIFIYECFYVGYGNFHKHEADNCINGFKSSTETR